MFDDYIKNAIKEACRRAGNQLNLSKISTVSQGQISDYLCGRRKIENMALGTLEKLFPYMKIDFFGDQNEPRVGSIQVGGTVGGRIQQNINGKMTIREDGEIHRINYDMLGRNLRKDERFSPEEKLKFLDFLDEQK